MNNLPSERFNLNREDIKKWSRDCAVFFAPAVVLYVGVLKMGGSTQQANVALYGWALNTIYDLAIKFIKGN